MFDIGIMELGLIAVVALLVIGPERLPAVARTVGFWFGKARKFVSSVQEDFNREVVKSEELKRLVEEQGKIKDVHEIIEQTIDESRKTVATGAKLTGEQKQNEQIEQKETPQIDSQDSRQEQRDSQPVEPATQGEPTKTKNVE
ncbi:Sec-independent protein translocase protein TatB [Kaarinaea lacus]